MYALIFRTKSASSPTSLLSTSNLPFYDIYILSPLLPVQQQRHSLTPLHVIVYVSGHRHVLSLPSCRSTCLLCSMVCDRHLIDTTTNHSPLTFHAQRESIIRHRPVPTHPVTVRQPLIQEQQSKASGLHTLQTLRHSPLFAPAHHP